MEHPRAITTQQDTPAICYRKHPPSGQVDLLALLHWWSDWYVATFSGGDIFFGYVILNGDVDCAEWGYFSFTELKEIRVGGWCEIDCELESCWRVKVFSEVDKVSQN